jgi:hypothetical protein
MLLYCGQPILAVNVTNGIGWYWRRLARCCPAVQVCARPLRRVRCERSGAVGRLSGYAKRRLRCGCLADASPACSTRIRIASAPPSNVRRRTAASAAMATPSGSRRPRSSHPLSPTAAADATADDASRTASLFAAAAYSGVLVAESRKAAAVGILFNQQQGAVAHSTAERRGPPLSSGGRSRRRATFDMAIRPEPPSASPS